jgi:hypothetical protein
MLANPIVLKELVQAARHRRTYLIRAGLPAVAALLLLPQLFFAVSRHGRDWRAVASVSRPLFMTSAWLQLVVFSLLAFSLAAEALAREWRERTVEVLRVTALSSAGIVYGKLVGALGQVLMAALALLPFTAVLYFLSRLPQEVALGSFAIIVGSVLLCGSVGVVQGAAVRVREHTPADLLLFAILLGGLAFLDAYVWVGHPLLEAAIPPRALWLVLEARAPTGWSVGQFALLSVAILVGASACLLAVSPALYDHTFARRVGTPERKTLGERVRRRFRGRRPAMKPEENAFFWQEKGPATRVLSWSVLFVFGVVGGVYGILAVFVSAVRRDLTLGGLGELCTPAVVVGVGVMLFGSALYGARVFSREKSQHTAAALLLTGRPPETFFCAKIKALYWAHRYSFVALGLVLATLLFLPQRPPGYPPPGYSRNEYAFFLLACVLLLLFGPGLSALVGMVFGVVSKSPQEAARALFLSLLWFQLASVAMLLVQLLNSLLGSIAAVAFSLAAVVGVLAELLKWTRRWTPWRMSLILALCFAAFSAGVVFVAALFDELGRVGWVFALPVAFGLVAGFAHLWWRLGMHVFEEEMAREAAATSRPGRG